MDFFAQMLDIAKKSVIDAKFKKGCYTRMFFLFRAITLFN